MAFNPELFAYCWQYDALCVFRIVCWQEFLQSSLTVCRLYQLILCVASVSGMVLDFTLDPLPLLTVEIVSQ